MYSFLDPMNICVHGVVVDPQPPNICLSFAGHNPSKHNVGLMLAHRSRLWPNINPTLVQCLLLARQPDADTMSINY